MTKANVGFDAELPQNVEADKRSGNDGGLGDLGGGTVAFRREIRRLVKFPASGKATAINPTIQIRWRALTGKKKADSRLRATFAKENRIIEVELCRIILNVRANDFDPLRQLGR